MNTYNFSQRKTIVAILNIYHPSLYPKQQYLNLLKMLPSDELEKLLIET